MKFCNKCGEDLINESCPNCSATHNSKPKKKNNNLIIGVIFITVILIGGIFIFGKSTSKTQLEIATEFSNAVSTKNPDKLQQILYCKNQELKINKTNANVLIDYLTENPSMLSRIDDNFKKGNYGISDNSSDTYPISIKEISKTFFFFPVYKVVVEPTFLTINSNFKNYKVTVLDQVYDNLNKKFEIGPLMPGDYNIIAEISNSYLHKSETLNVNTFEDIYPEIDVFEDLRTVNIDSDIPDADLYVNDKNTGLKIRDAKNFGPVERTSVLHAISNKNGKNIISPKYKVYSDSHVYINFADAKALEEDFNIQLSNLLNNYCSDFAYAVNYNDFDSISSYLKRNSPIYNKQKEVVSLFYNQDIRESFKSVEILNYKFNVDTNSGEVTCKEIYSIAKDDNVAKYQQFKNTYTFEKNYNGSLVLTDIKDKE